MTQTHRKVIARFFVCSLVLGMANHARAQLEELPPAPSSAPSTPSNSVSSKSVGRGAEVVRERHPGGTIAVERHVALDSDQNYVNHGPYATFDETGAKISSGQYTMGKRTGMWTRWYRGHDAGLLQEPPFNMFRPPFISQANFRNGKLDGAWVIYDAQQQKVSELNFTEGKRNGPAAWWYPNGGKMRELAFVENVLQGAATFYRANGQVARTEKYDDGHRIQPFVQKYPEGGKFCEGTYRHPKTAITSQDDWDAMQYATFELQGEGSKEGEWTVYYPNGQRQMKGAYDRDKPVGAFTWWHPTGQRASVGKFVDGGKAGQWTWWHPNGMKKSQGAFREDTPFGRWASWDEQGGLINEIEAMHDAESIAQAMETLPGQEQEPEDLPTPLDGAEESASQAPSPAAGSLQEYFLPARLTSE